MQFNMLLGGQSGHMVRNKGSFLCIFFNFKGLFGKKKKEEEEAGIFSTFTFRFIHKKTISSLGY